MVEATRATTAGASALTDYLSTNQAARVLEVSPMTVQKLLDAGELEGLRTPCGRLYLAESVHRMAAARREAAGVRG